MVSFTLDAIKFLLIYRYLQNAYWFSVGVKPLLVPQTEALALPGMVERATQRPTPICIETPFHRVHDRILRTQKIHETNAYIHIPQTSTVALSVTIPRNCQISVCQEQSAVNALNMLRLSPPALTACLRQPLGVGFPFPQRYPGLPPPRRQRLSVENQPQIYDLFFITNIL